MPQTKYCCSLKSQKIWTPGPGSLFDYCYEFNVILYVAQSRRHSIVAMTSSRLNEPILAEVCALFICGHRFCHIKLLRFQFLTNLYYPATNLLDFSNDELQKYDL